MFSISVKKGEAIYVVSELFHATEGIIGESVIAVTATQSTAFSVLENDNYEARFSEMFEEGIKLEFGKPIKHFGIDEFGEEYYEETVYVSCGEQKEPVGGVTRTIQKKKLI